MHKSTPIYSAEEADEMREKYYCMGFKHGMTDALMRAKNVISNINVQSVVDAVFEKEKSEVADAS